MDASKHTKGPWKVFETPHGKVVGIGRQSDGYAVADAGFGIWGERSEEAAANARLIAAAPDLLDACKRAAEILRGRGYPGWGVAKDILNEAIAAATGEAQP